MPTRVLFVPFDTFGNPSTRLSRPGYDYLDKNAAWMVKFKALQAVKRKVKEGHVVRDVWQVHYSPTAENSALRGVGPADQVYIRGHSEIGYEGVFDHANVDERGRDSRTDPPLEAPIRDRGDFLNATRKVSLSAEQVAKR